MRMGRVCNVAAALMLVSGCGGGVKMTDLKVGDGPEAKKGDTVAVHYTGWLSNGKKFDSGSYEFTIGRGDVIKGWHEGIVGMQVGGKRKLVIPPEKAYGEQGNWPAIPPNAELTFEVELVAIK